MKARKLSLVAFLVVLSVILLAAPVQAGRAVETFTFTLADGDMEVVDYAVHGATERYELKITGTCVSGSEKLNGGQLTWLGYCTASYPPGSPHPLGWGPCEGSWQIIAAGDASSGWKGRSVSYPMSDPDKFPKTYRLHGQGNGFGAYDKTHIDYSAYVGGDTDLWIYAGEISEQGN